jgi:small-conductance mechanosensitive channel
VANEQPQWIERLDELHLLTPLRILAIIIIAIVTAIVLRFIVSRLLRRTIGIPGSDPSRLDARQRALESVLRSAVVGVVWAVAVITIISELGVNVGGFIATATIIGGAVAFGCQTLIRDVIGGLFVLAEDQYGVGDTVDLGYAIGQVERITLRSVRLCDSEGKVWHVAHGNVMCVANLSKSSIALLDIEIARDSDLAVVDEVATRLGAQLREHESAGPLVTGDPSIIGIVDVRDDRLIYRVTAPTLPGRRDEVKRAWRVLALGAFSEGELRSPPDPPTVANIITTAPTTDAEQD